jgi:hypothetical protein
MAYKTRRERRAEGGKAEETEPLHPEHGHQYNAKGSPEEKEESAKPDGFKRGGAKKRKEGGKVEGEKARHHLGRRARGGHTMPANEEVHRRREHEARTERERHEERPERARGGRAMKSGETPFSSAHNTKPPGNDKDGPGEQAAMIP